MRASKPKNKTKKLFWHVHHWVGLYTGILIGILSITGALAVFIPEIDFLVLKYKYNVSFSESSTDEMPRFSRSIDSLTSLYPNHGPFSLILDNSSVARADVSIESPTGGFERQSFFINTNTDQVVAERNYQNSLVNYLRQMHVRLYEGYWGRQLVGIGGIALAIVAISGLMIYGNFMKKQTWPTIRKNLKLRIVMADWHKILGISSLAFNVMIALTGAWLGLQPWLMRSLDIKIPNRYQAEIIKTPDMDRKTTIDWNKVFHTIKTEFPDLHPHYITPSVNGEDVITIRGNVSGQVYERANNIIILSKSNYKPIFQYDIREQPFSHKFYFIQEALHFGDFGGLWLKVIYALLGLTSGFLSISGFVIFLFRTKDKGGKPWKVIFLYSMLVVLFLVAIALISLFIGYTQASFVAGILINILLIGLCIYAILKYFIRAYREKRKYDNSRG